MQNSITRVPVSGRKRALKYLALSLLALALTEAPAHAQAPAHAVATTTMLPLGDGKVTSRPLAGNVYSCQTVFRNGARHDGPWFHGEMWAPLEKPRVNGRIFWPNAIFALGTNGDTRSVTANWLPVQQPTGKFPITRADTVYKYDTNPNGILPISMSFAIPLTPTRAAKPGCLPMGMIGFTLTGVALYNALDAAGRDAAAHEIQDLCDGHPQGKGQYHYHNASPCMPGADSSVLVGWALDGFPIMGMRDARGALITNADLDPCHGRAEQLTIEGRSYAYVYRLTREYPYTLGCFTGVVPAQTTQAIRQGMGPPRVRR